VIALLAVRIVAAVLALAMVLVIVFRRISPVKNEDDSEP
jgi:hypothetical protein